MDGVIRKARGKGSRYRMQIGFGREDKEGTNILYLYADDVVLARFNKD